MKTFNDLEPLEYLRIPWRRRWYFLAATVLVFAGTSLYAWYKPNLYRSETRVLVESSTLLDDPLTPAMTQGRIDLRVNAIRQLVESRTILQRIIEEFRLRASDTSMPLEDALKAMRANLEFTKATGSTFAMAYYATDPQVAQAVTRRLAEILIQTNQGAQKDKAIEKDVFLEQELRQAEMALSSVDEKIKQFKANNLGQLPEQSAANMNALNGLHNQLLAIDNALDRARDQQKMIEFKLKEQQRISALAKNIASNEKPMVPELKGRDVPSPLAIQLTNKRAQLAEFTARYTPKHPDVIRLAKEVEDLERQLGLKNDSEAGPPASSEFTPLSPADTNLPAQPGGGRAIDRAEITAEAEIAQARYELDLLNKTIERREKEREDVLKNISVYQGRLNLTPTLEQELFTLTREFEARRLDVSSLQTRKFNAQMAANAMADRKNETYRILDDASLPELPVFPAKLHIMLMGIAVSLIAGLAAAFAREFLEPSVANEEEASAVLKMPILVSVPEIPSEGPRALLK